MRLKILTLSFLAACATPRLVPKAVSPEPRVSWDDPARIEKLVAAATAMVPGLDATLAKTKAPGAAVGIVADGKLIWFHAVGERDVGTHAAVDEDTVFRIASMSKAFVSASVLKLRDEGRLSLDDPAEKYLPELRALAYPSSDSPRVTVRQLLSHSAGLPEDNATADLRMPMTDEEFDQLLAKGLSFSNAPGTGFEYSNLGFALAGRLVKRVSGIRLQDYVSRNLVTPLGMSSTVWDAAAVAEEHKAHGYGRKGSNMPSKGLAHYEDDAPHEEPVLADGAWAPIGGLWTSSRDYAKWVAFQLAAWPARDEPDTGPVHRASLREAQQTQRSLPMVVSRNDRGELDAYAGGYGLGWGVRSTCDFSTVVAHSGGLPGYGSHVLLLPAEGVGFFSMTNLTYTSAAGAVVDLVKGLRARGLLPERPLALSPQLQRARAGVNDLLSAWDDARAKNLFDVHYASYLTPEKQRLGFARLHERHGPCAPAIEASPENALRGVMQLKCDRGSISMSVELTSDVPPRIQALVLESILPPSPQLEAAAQRANGLLAGWDDSTASEILSPDVDIPSLRKQLQSVANFNGTCRIGRPLRGDGVADATFLLACEHGDVELTVTLANDGRLSLVRAVPAPGGPRCAR